MERPALHPSLGGGSLPDNAVLPRQTHLPRACSCQAVMELELRHSPILTFGLPLKRKGNEGFFRRAQNGVDMLAFVTEYGVRQKE